MQILKYKYFKAIFPLDSRTELSLITQKPFEEAMRKADFNYEHSKERERLPNWNNNRTSKFD